jgi:hypothetical protein
MALDSSIKLYINGDMYKPPAKASIYQTFLPAKYEDLLKCDKTNVGIDPIYGTLMLSLLPVSDVYNTTVDGELTRPQKTDFTLTDANWESVNMGFASNFFLLSKNNTTETVYTKKVYEANRGFVIRFFVYPSIKKQFVAGNFFFGQFKLTVYSTGYATLFDLSDNILQSGYLCNGYNNDKQQGTDYTSKYVTLTILPLRRNTLIFYSDNGGWTYTDESISNSKYNPSLIKSAKFGFNFPVGKGLIQVLPTSYPTTGSITLQATLPYRPTDDAQPDSIQIEYEAPAGTTATHGDVIFTDITGSINCIAKLTLTLHSGGKYTPLVYSAKMYWKSATANMIGDQFEVTTWRAESMTLSMPEDRSTHELTWTVDDEDIIDQLAEKVNRTVKLMDGTNEGFIGLTCMPEKSDPVAPELQCKARDLWSRFENTQLFYPVDFSGMKNTDIIEWCALMCGIPAERMKLDTANAFDIPTSGLKDQEEWQFEPGVKYNEIIEAINDNYIGWRLYFAPDIDGLIKLQYRSEESDILEPVKTLYSKTDNSLEHTIDDTYWKDGLRYTVIEPHCNYLRVEGLDEYGNALWADVYDKNSINPDLTESERPDNWLGEIRYSGYKNTSLITQEMVNWVAHVRFNDISSITKLIEFVSEYDYLIQPFTCVKLMDFNNNDYVIVKITGIEIHHDYISPDTDFYQPATYVGEIIEEV